MNEFYVSLIFIGIVMISVSLIMILLDKKKAFSFLNNYEKKKQELMEIIYDAEQMIEELNKFSDYVVTQMDFKNEELSINLKKAREEILALTQSLKPGSIKKEKTVNANEPVIKERVSSEAAVPVRQEPVVNDDLPGTIAVVNEHPAKPGSSYERDSIDFDKVHGNNTVNNIKKEKAVPVNNKYSEVVRLFKAGMDNVDIAKRMNMGKGEVQLILELNK